MSSNSQNNVKRKRQARAKLLKRALKEYEATLPPEERTAPRKPAEE